MHAALKASILGVCALLSIDGPAARVGATDPGGHLPLAANALAFEAAEPGEACDFDADCLPQTCCHATACVQSSKAPSCRGVMCTQDCRPDTMDCGGGCSCQQGVCVAHLTKARLPRPAVELPWGRR